MHKRALASLSLGFLFSGVCLWYAFRGVDLSAMASGISQVGIPWIIGSVLGAFLSLTIRAFRWRLLLAELQGIRWWSLVSATFIGVMANNLLPARLGEVVRAWVLANRERRAVSAVLGSIVIERLLDVLTALTILGLGLAITPELGGGATLLLKRVGLIVLLMVVASVLGLLLAVRFRKRIVQAGERWTMRIHHLWVSRGVGVLSRFLDGFDAYRGKAQVTEVAILSVLVWMVAIGSFYVLAEGFNLGLTPVQTALVFVVVLFGVAVPSAPGFVGTFHGFCVAGLGMIAGTEPTRAAAYATLLHGSHWLAMNLVGLGCLLTDRSITRSGMTRLIRQG